MTQFENITRRTCSQFGHTYYMVNHPVYWGYTDAIEVDGERGAWAATTWMGLGSTAQRDLRWKANEAGVKLSDLSEDWVNIDGGEYPRMSIVAEAKTLKELDALLTEEVVRKVLADGEECYDRLMEKLGA